MKTHFLFLTLRLLGHCQVEHHKKVKHTHPTSPVCDSAKCIMLLMIYIVMRFYCERLLSGTLRKKRAYL